MQTDATHPIYTRKNTMTFVSRPKTPDVFKAKTDSRLSSLAQQASFVVAKLPVCWECRVAALGSGAAVTYSLLDSRPHDKANEEYESRAAQVDYH
jgi:hypothetical protein